ncbi:MAG TPA: M36 family metallopeptidase [Saprospiraceae bacterium]|nr:M36 family metallopeptidase [Saprospiraceae bacterium]
MKKILLLQTVIALSVLSISSIFGQSTDYLSRAYEYLKNNNGLDQKAIGELKIKDQYRTDHNNVEHVYLVQSFHGIEILGASLNLAFLPDGRVLGSDHKLTILDGLTFPSENPKINAPQAISITGKELGIISRSVPDLVRYTNSGLPVYSKEDISHQDIPASLCYLRDSKGEYRLVWTLQIESTNDGELYQTFVDALNGQLIAKDKLTLHCQFENNYLLNEPSCNNEAAIVNDNLQAPPVNAPAQYRVLPLGIESPAHGNFDLISGAEDPVASPYGWHDTNGSAGAEFHTTRGNNVYAFLDRDWNYSTDGDADGGANLIFDFPFDAANEPSGNQNVAVTNLFFWNNIMHDIAYKYGFNEVAGNFQAKNYSNQGNSDDYVEAHSQFGDSNPVQCGIEDNGNVDCLNNANFASPIDGFNGRMKMFTWNQNNSNRYLDVLEPVELAGKILTGLAQFGPDITTTPTTGNVVIANDGSSTSTLACSPLEGQQDLTGKIAIIDRGVCDFSRKVYYAQEAGALGVIICNFEEANIPMGAADFAAEVVIPSVMISYSDCQRIRVAAADGLKVSIVAPIAEAGPQFRDGSLDNSIVSHEYGHGISTRLTGGPSTSFCLTPGSITGTAEEAYGMGEGWSDFFALAVTAKPGDTGAKKRGIGTYASKESQEGRGLRSFPYSTDLSINPHTYDDILFESVPHGVGSVWTAMLWDLYWAFSDAYGWDPDVYNGTGGNNIAMQLVMDGLKLQPCYPLGFIEARNAILQADQINNNGVNECLIWEVFARRGLGWNADGGDPGKRSDGIEGFETMPTCLKELKLTKTMTSEIKAGDQIEVTLYAINHTGTQLTNVFLEDPVPDGTSYITGSANIAPFAGNTLVWNFDQVEPGEEITITYSLLSDDHKNSVRLFIDDIEGDPIQRWDFFYDETEFIENIWTAQDAIVHSGQSAWSVADVEVASKHWLQNYQPLEVSGDYPVYRFYHYYNTETGADGGFLEISTDGNSFYPLEDKIFRNGYPRRLQYGTFAIPGLYAYSGKSDPTFQMTPVYVDLSDYAGQEVYIRYKFGTDENTAGDGWYIDDVELMDAVIYNSTACITSDQTDPVCDEAPERGTIVDSEVISSTNEDSDNSLLSMNPNPAGDFVQVILPVEKSDEAVINVFDLTGHLLYSAPWHLSAGTNQHVINLQKFNSGMYVVHVSSREFAFSKKFVKG